MSSSHLSLGPDTVEAALEAGCATLLTLQLLRESAADELHRTQLTREIKSVRRVIAEFRAHQGAASNPLAYGFVL